MSDSSLGGVGPPAAGQPASAAMADWQVRSPPLLGAGREGRQPFPPVSCFPCRKTVCVAVECRSGACA